MSSVMGDNFIEFIRKDVVLDDATSGAAVVRGIVVLKNASDNVVITCDDVDEAIGIAMNAATGSDEKVSVLRSGRIRIRADNTTATLVVSGEGASMTPGSLVYVTTAGKFSSSASSTQRIGYVWAQPVTTSTYEEMIVEVDFSDLPSSDFSA